MNASRLRARLQAMVDTVPSGAHQAQAKMIMTRGLDAMLKQREIEDYCVMMPSTLGIDVAVQPAGGASFMFYCFTPKTPLADKVWVQPHNLR